MQNKSTILINFLFILISLSFSLISSGKSENNIKKLDRIVAIVDQEVITEKELEEKLITVINTLKNQKVDLPPENILKKQVIERMIINSLQIQLASETGIKVSDNQIDKTIDRIAEKNKLNITDFKKMIEKDGTPFYKFKESIKNEIIISQLKEREIDSKILITDGEIDNYLSAQKNESSEEFEVAHILIKIPEDASPEKLEKIKNKAEDAAKSIQNGKSFFQVSATFSDASNALEGGLMGIKKSNELPTLFLDALKKLDVGKISPILRSPSGFHILKLISRKGGETNLIVDQSHVRHILIKFSEINPENEIKKRLLALKERIENGTKFEELARQYSEDPSASNGGDLGWINPGDTVPEFEKTISALKINEVSDPIKTPFGFHLIQVLERRSQDISKDAARIKARQEIKMRKSEEAYESWIQELRDKSFVEIHLEDTF
ncbi:MAG: molecular chaperone SurA [Proteobacteria bacterium]|nr:molecular chaperone SurA [Candidatus Fonsibacter sp. PEL5]